MGEKSEIIPPHLNAEVYRRDTTGTNNIPYLDYIRIHEDGSTLIGCSELTGRYWNGGAKILKSPTPESQNIQNFENCFIALSSGNPDGCFLESSKKVLLCEDNGTLSVWVHNSSVWTQWEEVISVSEHDDAALVVDCLDSGKEYVTGGADGNIKVWDINDMICMINFSQAHSMAIPSVVVNTTTHKIASGSLDRHVTLWDKSIKDEVVDIKVNDSGVRAVQWMDENRLLFGDEAGALSIVDFRNAEQVTRLAQLPAPVHRILANQDTNSIAVCGDNKIVTVYELNSDNTVTQLYRDAEQHTNYVRGLSWDQKERNVLYSVAWDGMLFSHKFRN